MTASLNGDYISRGEDRRSRRDPARLAPERRDGLDRRACQVLAPMPGGVRVGHGEAAPRRERRRYPEAG